MVQLQVGNKYKRRDGHEVFITGEDGSAIPFLCSRGNWYWRDGRSDENSLFDLVEELTVEQPKEITVSDNIRTVSAGINSDVVPVAVPSQRFDVLDWEGDAVCRGFRCEEEAVAYCTRNRGDYDKDCDLFVCKLTPIIRVTE